MRPSILSQHPLRLLTLTALATAALYACGSDETTGGTGGGDSLADVIYAGGTTDEALDQLLAATPTNDPSHAANFDAPADGAKLDPNTVPTFSWHIGSAASHSIPAPNGLRFALSFDPPRPAWRSPVASLAPLSDVIGPPRAAHAHGAPFNGTGYFIVFSTEKDAKLVRAFTGDLTFTPDATAWDKLKNAGATIKATLTSGIFDNNNLTPDGGPFQGGAITFTVGP